MTILSASIGAATDKKQAHETRIVILEPLQENNPYRSKQIRDMYEDALTVAKQDLDTRDNESQIKISSIYTNSPDLRGQIQSIIGRGGANTVIIGLTFSGDTQVILDLCSQNKVIFISPAASHPGLYEPKDSCIPLGTSVDTSLRLIGQVIKSHEDSRYKVITAKDSAFDRMTTNAIDRAVGLKPAEVLVYSSQKHFHGRKFELNVPNVLLTGYAHASLDTLLKSECKKPCKSPLRFYGTSQWGYAESFLAEKLELHKMSLSIATDFARLSTIDSFSFFQEKERSLFEKSKSEALQFEKRFKATFKRAPFEFSYAVYDSIRFAHRVVAQKLPGTSLTEAFNTDTTFAGASGPFHIKNGMMKPYTFLSSWNQASRAFVPTGVLHDSKFREINL